MYYGMTVDVPYLVDRYFCDSEAIAPSLSFEWPLTIRQLILRTESIDSFRCSDPMSRKVFNTTWI